MGVVINLENYKSNMKEVSSTDQGNNCLIDDEAVEIYNFDKIKKAVGKQLGKEDICKSCDGLFISQEENVLIEFKCQSYTRIEQDELGQKSMYGKQQKNVEKDYLKKKAFDSKGLLNVLRDSNVISAKSDILYIVYQKDENKIKVKKLEENEVEEIKPEITRRFQTVGRKKKKKIISFGLEKMEGTIYDEVYTYSDEEFRQQFLKK